MRNSMLNMLVQRSAARVQGAPRANVAGLPAQGVQDANLDGCGAGCGAGTGCAVPGGQIPASAYGRSAAPYIQENSLLGVFVQPADTEATTLEISCGNTFFEACGARAFTPANAILLTSIVSGFQTRNQLCPGSGIDVAFFQTDSCYCPFSFGCFSQLAPLSLTIDPVDVAMGEPIQPLNMVLVGRRLEMDGCFPPGVMPYPTGVQGVEYRPAIGLQPAALPQG